MAAGLTNCLPYSEANLKTIHDLDFFIRTMLQFKSSENEKETK